jgi:phosphoribosylformylglycinamidine cyclo-ligase
MDLQRDSSMWSRGRKDLATPQGTSLATAFLICAFIAIIFEIVLGRVLKLPNAFVYPAIIVVDIAILIVAVIKIAAINKKAEAARREIYRQKFEGDMEAIKNWDKRKAAKSSQKLSITYEDAGVSIDTMDAALSDVKEMVKSTYRPEVLSHMGQFGGLFALDKSKYSDPVLVSSNDGVGTKLKLAFMTGKHKTVGADLVAHCGNDIVVLGAEPLFFMDYLGVGKLERDVMVQIIEGLTVGCKEIGCALIGGETAEMPSFYKDGEYDLVGSIVGIVDRDKIITGEKITPGDQIIGLASSGLHTNGYSLARKVMFEVCRYDVDDHIQKLGTTVGDELLKTHRSYVKPVLEIIKKYNSMDFHVKGISHITGGGLMDNIPRILPERCNAILKKGSWDILPVFKLIQEKGNVAEDEMYRVFNMGLGMVMVVSYEYADQIAKDMSSLGETVYRIGEITQGPGKIVFV